MNCLEGLTNSIDVSACSLAPRPGAQASRRGQFGYDATEDKGRRKPPIPLLRSEDDELPTYRRNQLQHLGRDIRRNFAIAAWMIRRHLDYVSRFRFRSTTGHAELDKRIESLVAWCGLARNFDRANRHGLRKYLRTAEASRVVDGDMLNVFLSTGRVQAIEGDRIRTPISYGATGPQSVLPAATLERMKAGVVTDEGGAALAYAVNRRGPAVNLGPDLINPAGSFFFERLVPAKYCHHLAYFERFDQVRGVSPIAAALNSFRDTYEGFDYALAQAKVAQLFALVLKRNSPAALAAAGEGGPTEYDIDFSRGPVLLDLDPGDVAEFLNSNNPSANWQAFMTLVLSAALKSLDIPYSFYDESHTNYSGSRGAWLMYDQAAEDKRDDLREFLDRWVAWRLGMLIYQGVLELPAGFDPLRDLSWSWIARKVPWIDPLREIQAARLEVDGGFNSTVRVANSLGLDAYEMADEEAAYRAYRAGLGLPPPGSLPPVPVQIAAEGDTAAAA